MVEEGLLRNYELKSAKFSSVSITWPNATNARIMAILQ
jgi:hypothetical protein